MLTLVQNQKQQQQKLHMDPGTPTRQLPPPDYYAGGDGSAAGVRLLGSTGNNSFRRDNVDDDVFADDAYSNDGRSSHAQNSTTTGHFATSSAGAPQLPQIRPFASSTSYVPSVLGSGSSCSNALLPKKDPSPSNPTSSSFLPSSPGPSPNRDMTPRPLSLVQHKVAPAGQVGLSSAGNVVSRVAAAVSTLEQRQRQQQQNDMAPTESASPSSRSPSVPSPVHKTVKFADEEEKDHDGGISGVGKANSRDDTHRPASASCAVSTPPLHEPVPVGKKSSMIRLHRSAGLGTRLETASKAPKAAVTARVVTGCAGTPDHPDVTKHTTVSSASFSPEPLGDSDAASPYMIDLDDPHPTSNTTGIPRKSTSKQRALKLHSTNTNRLGLSSYTESDPFQTSAGTAPRAPSILDPPLKMAPPREGNYSPFRHGRTRSASPTRPWTPSGRRSPIHAGVPPIPAQYEPVDLNGSPRPGTPSSQYGGSPRRPLPPAPLFSKAGAGSAGARTSTFADDATISIPLEDDEGRTDVSGGSSVYSGSRHSQGHQQRGSTASYRYEAASGHDLEDDDEGDDVFRPRSNARQGMFQGNNFSQVTLNDPDAGMGDDDNGGKDIADILREKEGYEVGNSEYDDDDGGDLTDGVWKNGNHYGPAPEGRQERRGVREPHMSKKAVQLINGELVLECKIPTILFSFLPRRDEIEFTHMRYTAVTCDPDDFVPRGYKLRQNIGRTARETELFICVTMYNENAYDFTRTMHAIMKNVSHFCSRNKSRTWGEQGWQKIVVCVVSDGREKIHPRTLDALAAMGVYQHGIAKNYVNQKAVQAHVYEYTTQVSLDSDLKFKGAEKGIVPCQMIFCLKERNQRKLNSHRWFFNAFGRALNPNVCILLDVGTRPGGNSLYHLWKAFDTDSNVAGACGEIKAMKGRFGTNLLNPLVASQNFEYKMSNILDKPMESVFGYITVLPGALSAYRYHALQKDETGHGPLSQYFKGETLHGQHADVFTANMYLAEDRILCWELVAKRGERWVLKYVKSCTGETDVPDSVPEFISQRRRWLNGAFFAAVYSLVHFRQLWLTDHSIARKVLLHVEFLYQFVQLLFTYFSLANFYLTFYFIAGGLADPKIDPFGHHIGQYIFTILRYTCTLLIATQFILSLGNRPQGAKKLYMTSMILYVIIMVYTTFACIYIVIKELVNRNNPKAELSMGNNVFTNMIVSLSSTVGLYFFMSFLYLDPWHMFTSAAQYFALLPSYICTLQVYAFCNTHDVTWGTKGDNVLKTDLGGAVGKGSTVELEMPSEQLDIDSGYDEALRNLRDRVEVPAAAISEAQLQEDYYKSVRTYMVVCWMVANGILAMAVSEAYGQTSIGNNFYLSFILWSVAVLAFFRALGSSTFALINVVNMVVEGRVRLSLKMPEWAGGFGSRVSDTLSSIGSSVRR